MGTISGSRGLDLNIGMTGIFITATGTDIGKTYVACQLLKWDQAHWRVFTACKPVISGWPTHESEIYKTDSALLLAANQLPITAETLDRMSPWRFHLPLTPDMAARREGKNIVPEALLSYCQQLIEEAKQASKAVLIEGAGGIMAPISGKFTALDWITQLESPCILIAGSYLGTLSHTLTAVEVLQMKNVNILAIVVNETLNSTVSLQETCECLQSFLPYPIIAWPYSKQTEGVNKAVSTLYNSLLQSITNTTLLQSAYESIIA